MGLQIIENKRNKQKDDIVYVLKSNSIFINEIFIIINKIIDIKIFIYKMYSI